MINNKKDNMQACLKRDHQVTGQAIEDRIRENIQKLSKRKDTDGILGAYSWIFIYWYILIINKNMMKCNLQKAIEEFVNQVAVQNADREIGSYFKKLGTELLNSCQEPYLLGSDECYNKEEAEIFLDEEGGMTMLASRFLQFKGEIKHLELVYELRMQEEFINWYTIFSVECLDSLEQLERCCGVFADALEDVINNTIEANKDKYSIYLDTWQWDKTFFNLKNLAPYDEEIHFDPDDHYFDLI